MHPGQRATVSESRPSAGIIIHLETFFSCTNHVFEGGGGHRARTDFPGQITTMIDSCIRMNPHIEILSSKSSEMI